MYNSLFQIFMIKPLGVLSCKKDLDPSTEKKHTHVLNLTAQHLPCSKVKHECNAMTFFVLLDRLTAMGQLGSWN